jgi:hypothetical protein
LYATTRKHEKGQQAEDDTHPEDRVEVHGKNIR